jgi:hypothetical protein
MKLLIPLCALVWAVWMIATAIRQARGTVLDDLKILQASIENVRMRSSELPPEIAQQVNAKLELAAAQAESLGELLESAGTEQHEALRLQIASALALVSEARLLVDQHSPAQQDDDAAEDSEEDN